jgi:5-carboxyvanillate decarboxylase
MYKRIATEEAFAPPEMIKMYREALAKKTIDDLGFNSMWGFYSGNPSQRATEIVERLQWLDERRIKDMDDTGIDMQILSLTSPGVQMFDAATATSLAKSSNDQLADAIKKHPTRFAGLVAVAPQDPQSAAREIERGIKSLGLKGVIINSHTRGEYLDDSKYWDIFAAAEALNAPVYIHPNTPSPGLIKPFLERGLEGAVYGFSVEVALHVLRLIVSGVFDQFPKLQVVIGHMGEALPFWLFRLDYMYLASVQAKRYPQLRPVQKKPSDYIKENIFITTSGMPWEPALLFTQSVVGIDRVMYAMDYPYQFVADEVRAMDNMALSDANKKKFFQTNAERVFSL